jgi:hypothetical protein
MANTDRPRGLWPIRHLNGGQITTNEYQIDTDNTDLITKGDPILMEADGYCARGAANGTFLGVAAGFVYQDSDGDWHYSDQVPATKTGFKDRNGNDGVTVYVWDDPDIVFGIQADGNTTIADRFNTFPIVISDGNTTTKISNCELDSTGGSGDELKILDKVKAPNNDWGTNVDLEVLINDHHYRAVKAGV